MASQAKSENNLLDKVGNLFSAKEEKTSNGSIEAKVVQESFLDTIKSRLFGAKVEDVIDVEAFEIVTADMELTVTEQDISKEGIVTTTTEVVAMEQLEHKQGVFASLSLATTNTLTSLKNTATDSWDFTTNKLSSAKNATVSFSSTTANSLVQLGKGVGKKYDEITFSPKFYAFVKTIDLLVVVNALQLYNNKQNKGSKEYMAVSTVIAILVLLERSKDKSKENLTIEGVDESLLSKGLPALLKSVTMKDVIATIEPVLLFVPNGNYILLILRLFV
ncbi:MAG: hypothetical protein LBI72_14995 [Flavobacteriaceae bacterium]|jgi:hypothetical protein|nr:hypothetical protein [Flavobacteriaceae bacterium]